MLLLGLLAGWTARAQQATPEHVELLIMEGEQAVFSSEGVGASKKDALEHSRMAVLRKLLFEGVLNTFSFPFPGTQASSPLQARSKYSFISFWKSFAAAVAMGMPP